MSEFLKYVDDLRHGFPVHVSINYSKITDWTIKIYKKGCAIDYPEALHDGNDVILVNVYDCDMELCFAKAHVALKEWLSEYEGGY